METREKIEITPAMIRAGVSALCRYDAEFESREEAVERIFRAMCGASEIAGMKALWHRTGGE